jgi:hypothetical protein
MRRTEYLLTELRNSTDNTDTGAIKDAEMISYLNYAQKLIQNLIYKSNPRASMFQAVEEYAFSSAGEYTLPDDAFAKNAVLKVEYKNGSKYYPIEPIDSAEYGRSGYWITDSTVVVQGYLYFDVRITYFRELPRMDKRWGKVSSTSSGSSLTLTVGYDANLQYIDDYISVVDKFGAQIRAGIFIDDYSGIPTLLTSDALTGVTNQHFVCSGKNSVNASELPNACETYLLDYTRQRIATRNVYTPEAQLQINFTDEQKSELIALFSNNQKDVTTLPITDFESFDF